MKFLDLFAGCGGGTLGFARTGFQVLGVDISKYSRMVFEENMLGDFIQADLGVERIEGEFDIILGGPPCTPWSSVNLHRRGKNHPDFYLLQTFFEHVRRLYPKLFILENVPPARMDAEGFANEELSDLYYMETHVIRYSDFGSPTRRRRMFIFGLRRDTGFTASNFFEILNTFRRKPSTVREAIAGLNTGDPDHIYPVMRTIHQYREKYRTGKYGWYILRWDEPAPSFGNIMKTYILHPDSANGGEPRVISVREALSIMGFPWDFRFPAEVPMSVRYQMVAEAVSPVFSEALAKAVLRMFENGQG